LGPFVFLLYINDITSGLACNIKLFADDTSLFIIIDDSIYIEASEILSTDLVEYIIGLEIGLLKQASPEVISFMYKRNTNGPNTDPGGPKHQPPPNQTRNSHVLLFVFYLLKSQLSN
jgi:hypothetical protein